MWNTLICTHIYFLICDKTKFFCTWKFKNSIIHLKNYLPNVNRYRYRFLKKEFNKHLSQECLL